jgi:hypothetical protein
MSSEVRTLLRSAVDARAPKPDVSGAWRRGRRQLARRRFAGALGVVFMVVGVSIGATALLTSNHESPSASSGNHRSSACGAPLSRASDAPPWTSAANPPTDIPHHLSRQGNIAAFVFGYPLQARRHDGRANKILWVVREPRNAQPLRISGHRVHTRQRIQPVAIPADSAPGEIYPSVVDAPTPGCWSFTLTWNGHRATIKLPYR